MSGTANKSFTPEQAKKGRENAEATRRAMKESSQSKPKYNPDRPESPNFERF